MSQIIMPALGGLRRNSTATDVIDMEASSRAASVVALVLLCTLLANFVQRILPSNWQFPDSNLAIIVGFFSALPLCSAATRPGKDFDTIFFLYLVPPILFESGYSLNQKDFFRNFTAIMLFAVVGTLISSIVTGMGLFYLARANWLTGIDPSSPRQGLLFGTLLSATDTVATIAVLRQMGVEPQLYALIFGEAHFYFQSFPSLVNIAACVPTPSQHAGESVLNDAVAVVLFQTVSSLSDDETNFHVSGQAILATAARFSGVFVGSVALGVAFGLLTALITKHVLKNAYAHSEVTIMICLAYLAFIVADDLDLSGLMAVFFAGIVMSHYAKYNLSAHGQQTTHHVARTLANWGELLTFMYFGFTILPVVNPSCESADAPEHLYKIEWSFVFWTLILCVLARGAAVLPLTALVNLLKRRERQRANRISLRSMLMLWFSILRGAVSFALGLTIEDTNRRYMIPCIVMVILFTNLFLGQATVPVLRLLKIPIGFTQEDEAHEVDVVSPASASVGRLHTLWRYVDEVHIKPLFGGRQRGVYRVQRSIYDDGPEGRLAPMLQSAPLADDSMHTGGGRACGEREGAQGGYSGAHAAGAADEAGNGLRLRRVEDLELLDMRPEGKSSVRRHGMMRGDEISADMSMWEEGNSIVARIGTRNGLNGRRRIATKFSNLTSERFRKWWTGREGDENGGGRTESLFESEQQEEICGWGASGQGTGAENSLNGGAIGYRRSSLHAPHRGLHLDRNGAHRESERDRGGVCSVDDIDYPLRLRREHDVSQAIPMEDSEMRRVGRQGGGDGVQGIGISFERKGLDRP